jgi:hypothetical protein
VRKKSRKSRKESPIEFSRRKTFLHARWLKLAGVDPANWNAPVKPKYESICKCCGSSAFIRYGSHCYCEKHKNVGRARWLRFMREHGKKVDRMV